MWELIRANRRRSAVLVVLMLVLLTTLGFVLGVAIFPGNTQMDPGSGQLLYVDVTGGMMGIAIAAALWIVQTLVAYFKGDAILLASSGARRITREDHPRLFNVVEEMTIAAQLPKVPEVYIIEDPVMNAFAAGRKPETAKVAVTSGLLEKLDRDQLQGVVAHEVAHIVHRDVLFMTMVGVMLGAIVMMSEIFLRSLRHMGSRVGGGRKRDGGAAVLVFVVLAVVLAILAPILAQLIYFACSRRREYLADAGGAVYTRYPEGLASALETLSGQHGKLQRVSKATAPLFIVNPFNPQGRAAISLFATHPPSEQRIAVLRGMAGGVSYGAYQTAWRKQSGSLAAMPAALAKEPMQPVRAAHEEALQEARERKRDTADALRNLHHFMFIPCACGMRIKLPPDWKEATAPCPRCGAVHEVPLPAMAVGAAVMATAKAKPKEPPVLPPELPPGKQTVSKPRNAWATVRCGRCGRTKSLGPSFDAPRTQCACGNSIAVTLT